VNEDVAVLAVEVAVGGHSARSFHADHTFRSAA